MKDKIISVKGNPQKSISAVKIAKEGVYNYIDAATGKTIGIPGQIQGYSSFFAKHCSPPYGACMSGSRSRHRDRRGEGDQSCQCS